MADRMDPQNYARMIEALNTFAANTAQTTQELHSACATCRQALGEGDVTAQTLAAGGAKIANKYATLAETAKAIAREMQAELDEYYHRLRRAASEDGDDSY